ncbi:MAG: glycosyltransferase, partial [Actinomycetia bacterium]|nr:glycosyltransferase [Actinomycetes bacterium]
MKILQIHNYYRYRGGEDIVFDDLKAILSDKSVNVKVYTRDSNSIKGLFRKIVSFFSLFYSIRAANDIRQIISEFKPDIAHMHNIYPLISYSILKVLKKNKIPVVQTTHNYRLFCANGLYLDRGKICEKCMELRFKNIFTDCRSESRLYNFLIALNIFFMRKRNLYSLIDKFIA